MERIALDTVGRCIMKLYTILRNLIQSIKNALQEAKDYTDSKQQTGSFTVKIPRLSNQSVTFNYVQLGDRIAIAHAEFTANSSTDTGRLYLFFEEQPNWLPFNPLQSFGACECGDVCYAMSTSGNRNTWIGGLTGKMASSKFMTCRIVLLGG